MGWTFDISKRPLVATLTSPRSSAFKWRDTFIDTNTDIIRSGTMNTSTRTNSNNNVHGN